MKNWTAFLSLQAIFNYFIHAGDATSQWINVVFLFSDNPNESISGRCWRLRHRVQWGMLRVAIDFIFSSFQDDHCRKAYEADVERARKLIAQKRVS